MLLAGIITAATAQKRVVVSLEDSGADEIAHFWDNSTAPHSNEITEDEQMNKRFDMTQTSSTDFYIYKADPQKATGQGVVIIPGGGYYKLSMKYDGFMIGQYLRSIGVTAIVVKYRLPNGHREVPLEDAQAALRFMRAESSKWGRSRRCRRCRPSSRSRNASRCRVRARPPPMDGPSSCTGRRYDDDGFHQNPA